MEVWMCHIMPVSNSNRKTHKL